MDYREIIIAIVWTCYAVVNGMTDGIMYHLKHPDRSVKTNEHKYFTVERGVVALGLLGVSEISWLSVGILIIYFFLSFSFLHNGAYYTMRNKLSNIIYEEKWFAQSTTSTAFWTKFMTPAARTALFIGGVLILAIYVFRPH